MGRIVGCLCSESKQLGGRLMTYSYTQISQYMSCPRRYRYRYLDGWKEKDTRAAMLFGRAFEQAVAASSTTSAISSASRSTATGRGADITTPP